MTFQNLRKISNDIFIVISKIAKKSRELHEPIFFGNELKYIKKCLESTFISTMSPFVEKLEKKLCQYTGSKYAIALNSGTSALQLSIILSGINRNEEVLVPTLNYISSSNAILIANAIPHFVDIDKKTLGIDTKKLRKYLIKKTFKKNNMYINKKTKRPIRAIIPMHTFGHPSNMKEIMKIAKDFRLKVIEDAAEGIGSFYKKRHVGTFGDIGILSFNGNKTITTGGGGLLLTQNKRIASLAKHISLNSKIIKNWQISHDRIGYNYRMPGINAAIGCAQIEKIEKLVKAKRKLFKLYNNELKKIYGLKLFKESTDSRSNYWLQTIILDKANKSKRDNIIKFCNKFKYKVRPTWKLMHKIEYLSKFEKMNLSNAENLEKKIINIPSSPQIVFDMGRK
tara:strand:- start:1238 stop:2425 length:1188 start_codon:yes stop_codon:yes gene_type:complete